MTCVSTELCRKLDSLQNKDASDHKKSILKSPNNTELDKTGWLGHHDLALLIMTFHGWLVHYDLAMMYKPARD